ncbi:MAG: LLM class flavin-dependent oxidoreductase [Rectinemataceae bacterium]
MKTAPDVRESKGSGMEIGLFTLGEYLSDPETGTKISRRQRLEEIIAAAQLADEAGLDVFGLGEHHRLDFVASAVPVVLAAIAQKTKKIRLTSAVTVLSTADPVREFENFATLDLLSAGRAEMIAGRGAFIESFPLFGYNLADYDTLFPEKIDLLLKLNSAERVTWQGTLRPALKDAEIAPRPEQKELPIWIGVGGSPRSVADAAALGLPVVLGIIGGASARFAPLLEYYRRTGLQKGQPQDKLKTGVTSYLHVAKSSQEALDEFYPYHAHYFEQLSKGRSQTMRLSRADFERSTRLDGAFFVGSPQQIIDKLLYQWKIFKHQRFLAQIGVGGMPFKMVARTIELFASEVAPVVRRETAGKATSPDGQD